jgi:hypothetical protein
MAGTERKRLLPLGTPKALHFTAYSTLRFTWISGATYPAADI